MKFLTASIAIAIVLTGCGRPAPSSDDYFETITPQSDAMQASEQRLRQAEDRARMAGQSTSAAEITPATDVPDNSSTTDLIEQAENELNAAEVPAPTPAPVPRDNSVVSNADDFEAIQQVETVKSELERVEELGKTYKTFDPKALPARKGGVDLDAYAAKNSKRKIGRKRYKRDAKKYSENFCADYVDAELAQVTFLLQGGPKSDALLLDADGDGFACTWTPGGHTLAKSRTVARSQPIQ